MQLINLSQLSYVWCLESEFVSLLFRTGAKLSSESLQKLGHASFLSRAEEEKE